MPLIQRLASKGIEMSDLLIVRIFFSLTVMTIGINMVGWFGLWRFYTVTRERGRSSGKIACGELKVPEIITPIIRIELAYYVLLLFYQFLTDKPLSSFWVIFMFLYHLIGFLGNERYRRSNHHDGKSNDSKRKTSVLLGTIATLDLVEFYILITFSHRLYLLSRW
jgi:hypothetical protein